MKNKYNDIVKTLPHSMDVKLDASLLPTLSEAVSYIDRMDFELIKCKLMSGDKLVSREWTLLEAEIAIQYYKNFLFLNKKYAGESPVLPPLLEVDEVWHHHIMGTRQYEKDCESIFGYFFHHYPYFGTRSEEDNLNLQAAFELVQKLHEAEFGKKMVSVWGIKDGL